MANCFDVQVYGLLHGYCSPHGFTKPFYKWSWLQSTALHRAVGLDTSTGSEARRRKTRMRNREKQMSSCAFYRPRPKCWPACWTRRSRGRCAGDGKHVSGDEGSPAAVPPAGRTRMVLDQDAGPGLGCWSWTEMLVLDHAGPGPGCWSWTRMFARLPASGSAQPEGTCPPSPASPELPWPWSQRGHREQNQRENTELSQSGSHFSGKNGLCWPPCCHHEQSRELRNTLWQPEADLALLNYGLF